MADRKQNFDNHARLVPIYHYVAAPIFLLNLVWTLWNLRDPSFSAVLDVLVAVALIILFVSARSFALKAQDRVIRVEMRVRMRTLLPEELQGRIHEFTPTQMVGLRFAGDAELPDLGPQGARREHHRDDPHQEADHRLAGGLLPRLGACGGTPRCTEAGEGERAAGGDPCDRAWRVSDGTGCAAASSVTRGSGPAPPRNPAQHEVRESTDRSRTCHAHASARRRSQFVLDGRNGISEEKQSGRAGSPGTESDGVGPVIDIAETGTQAIPPSERDSTGHPTPSADRRAEGHWRRGGPGRVHARRIVPGPPSSLNPIVALM